MNYKKLIAVTVALTVCAFTGSNVMARGGGGVAFGRGGFNAAGFRGGFRGRSFRGDRFHHRDFDDRFFFVGDFGDPFFYYPYPYYGYYSYGGYPYDYGYDSYDQPVYEGRAGYTDFLIRQVQLHLARRGYYHGRIDGVSGNQTRRAIREYERAHGLPEDSKIGRRLFATMGLEYGASDNQRSRNRFHSSLS
jgi:Putative peptidoglycan binding domain